MYHKNIFLVQVVNSGDRKVMGDKANRVEGYALPIGLRVPSCPPSSFSSSSIISSSCFPSDIYKALDQEDSACWVTYLLP